MFGFGGSEAIVLVVFVLQYVVALAVIYAVVRLAVKRGVRAALEESGITGGASDRTGS